MGIIQALLGLNPGFFGPNQPLLGDPGGVKAATLKALARVFECKQFLAPMMINKEKRKRCRRRRSQRAV